MKETGLVFMQTTVGDRSQAETLAKNLIVAKLAACAQVSGPIKSFYDWQGLMRQEQEYLLSMKTLKTRQAALAEYICAHHPYTTPEVIVMPISFANRAYCDWVAQRCSDQ